MYLNEFASGGASLDMTTFKEFDSLLESAVDLGIPHSRDVHYVSRNVVLNGIRFHLLEWGDRAAPPLIVLHGGNQSAHSWDLVSLHLADRFHVIALDQRGHGDSEWARDADYTVPQMADDVAALIGHEELVRPIVMGHSMGGLVTLTLALQRPEIPSALVLVDSGPRAAAQGVMTIRNFITHNTEFDHIDKFVDRVVAYDPYRSREHIERTARYNLIQRVDGAYISKSDRILHDAEFRTRRERSAPMFDASHLEALQFPVLVVRGDRSNILEPAAAEEFAAQLPQGTIVTVPDCGHNVHTQNTPGFLQRVRPFLDSQIA